MKFQYTFFLSFLQLLACALRAGAQPVPLTQVIPRPAHVEISTGEFILDKDTRLVARPGVRPATVNYLKKYLLRYYKKKQKTGTGSNTISLVLLADTTKAPEAYRLVVHTNGVTISSGSQAGIFYGIQTLIQLLPTDHKSQWALACGTITDQPHYAYRGMHLDVSRHFFPAVYIKRYLDLMALHKLNTFHWHLTDNEGWRLQVRAYPLLTAKGSKMSSLAKEKRIPVLTSLYDAGSDGYYTTSEVREIVRYAADRFITVIPEIDMPGHSQAALYAYPRFAAGTPADTADVFRPDKNAYRFFTNVLDEVCNLFPGKYIHIGGDEVDFKKWESDTAVVKLAASKGLAMKVIENDFINRISAYLATKGRKAIGWDELVDGPLDSNLSIMGWRLSGFAAQAAKQGHDVILSPYDYTYFDFAQHQKEDSVTVKMYLPLSKVYAFRPFAGTHVLGGQANLWTENIGNAAKLEYMLLPRMAALSEALWSPREARNWTDFTGRLPALEDHYRLWGFNYCKNYE